MLRKLWLMILCRMKWCEGGYVSGRHADEIWVGWRCTDCGRVKDYQPCRPLPDWLGRD
jgi:hypothetical protein